MAPWVNLYFALPNPPALLPSHRWALSSGTGSWSWRLPWVVRAFALESSLAQGMHHPTLPHPGSSGCSCCGHCTQNPGQQSLPPCQYLMGPWAMPQAGTVICHSWHVCVCVWSPPDHSALGNHLQALLRGVCWACWEWEGFAGADF